MIRSDQISRSVVSDSLRPHESQNPRPPVHHRSRSSLRLTSIESVMPSSHLILWGPLLRLPPVPPSIRVFSSELTLRVRWPQYWSCSFSIIPSKEIPRMISFWMDWLDVLAVQGTLKSLSPMHESEKLKWSHSVVSDSQGPHGLQPTRLLHPWDFPGKSTGVGCHCLLHDVLYIWVK